MKQKVQLGALRAAPGAASLPRTGRGEALVQQHFHKSSSLTDSHNPPFSPGGGARAPPRRRRAALGPMPYGNMSSDPHQLKNLYYEDETPAELKAGLQKRLLAHWGCATSTCP